MYYNEILLFVYILNPYNYFPRVGTPHGSKCGVRTHPVWDLILYVSIFSVFYFILFYLHFTFRFDLAQ